MAAKSLQELFVEELRDMYDGEKRLIKALPKMAKAAETGELQSAFTSHLRETERQVDRLEQVFRILGEKPRGKTCDGIMGIVEESKTAMQELDEGPVLDAALIAGAQKVEHYEIASYGTLAYFAELLGHDDAKGLLGETLDEEKATDEKLSMLARSKVNRQALMSAGSEDVDEDNEEADSTLRRRRRIAASSATANDTGASNRSRSTGSSRGTSRSSSASRSRASRSATSSSRRGSSSKRGNR